MFDCPLEVKGPDSTIRNRLNKSAGEKLSSLKHDTAQVCKAASEQRPFTDVTNVGIFVHVATTPQTSCHHGDLQQPSQRPQPESWDLQRAELNEVQSHCREEGAKAPLQ